jgi:hypothetical protein
MIIKNYLCDIKNEKKLECFRFDFFERSENKNKEGDESVAKHTLQVVSAVLFNKLLFVGNKE